MQNKFTIFHKSPNQQEKNSTNNSGTNLQENLSENLQENLNQCLDKIENQSENQSNPSRQKTILKLSLSTLLILMILGVGFLNQNPGQAVAPKSTASQEQEKPNKTAQANKPNQRVMASTEPSIEPSIKPSESSKPSEPPKPSESLKPSESPIETPIDKSEPDAPEDDIIMKAEEAAKTTAKKTQAAKTETIRVEAATENLQATATMPAKGNYSKLFGYGYDETWQDYRFHQGVDMDLAIGTAIKPILGGTISQIGTDQNQGEFIKIKHNSSLSSAYYGIKINSTLQKGAKIDTKTTLGNICQPPLFESTAKPHLHLELWQQNQAVNPLEFLGVTP